MVFERALKRQKTNPPEDDSRSTSTAAQTNSPLQPNTRTPQTSGEGSESQSNHLENTTQEFPHSGTGTRQSWYSRTWPRKAAPVTQVARQSISSASTMASEPAKSIKDKAVDTISTKPRNKRTPSLAMTLGKGKSTRPLPIDATITKVNVTPDSSNRSRAQSSATSTKEAENDIPTKTSTKIENASSSTENTNTTERDSTSIDTASQNDQKNTQVDEARKSTSRTDQRPSWIGWWSQAPAGETQHQNDEQKSQEDRDKLDTNKLSKMQETSSELQKTVTQQSNAQFSPPSNAVPTAISSTIQDQNSRRGWLQLWSSVAPDVLSAAAPTTNTTSETKRSDALAKSSSTTLKTTPAYGNELAENAEHQNSGSSNSTAPVTSLPKPSEDARRPSGWAFWSRESKPAPSGEEESLPHVGELAISDTPSQNRPRRASINLKGKSQVEPNTTVSKSATSSSKKPAPAAATSSKSSIKSKNEDVAGENDAKALDSKRTVPKSKIESSNATATARPPVDATISRPASPAPKKVNVEDQVLPSFYDTLRLQENPSLMQQLGRMLYSQQQPEPKHLLRVQSPPKIKHALAIGVHGYFPAPLIRSVLSQPTGTSIKFADMAAKSIRKHTKAHGYECEIKSAALEGEGKIAERLELLWKLLLNWIEEIRKSDFVLIACHSQGVPVAIMLVAKLIEFGCLNSAQVGICAMAGVNMGPFPEYKSRWISGSAGELFEFSDMTSRVSEDYLHALETVLKFGARLSFIGSIDDQLVSLESSIYAPITHPHIFRAVFIDGRIHAPNFLSHLIGFALKLRNIGVQDHGLIRELSGPLAGSLYGGEGHSRIYEDEAVYDLAVAFALETTSLPNISLANNRTPSSTTTGNPYVLPFAMRGILEEDHVKNDYAGEVQELLKQFDDWKPTTKVLKDVKFRLEGIRSRS